MREGTMTFALKWKAQLSQVVHIVRTNRRVKVVVPSESPVIKEGSGWYLLVAFWLEWTTSLFPTSLVLGLFVRFFNSKSDTQIFLLLFFNLEHRLLSLRSMSSASYAALIDWTFFSTPRPYWLKAGILRPRPPRLLIKHCSFLTST